MAGDYLTSGAVRITGLGSDTDFDAIIDAMVKAQSVHKQRLITWRTDWEDKQVAFQELNTMLLDLKTHMQTMDTMDEFFVKTGDISNPYVASATADSSAAPGTHTVVVTQIAQANVLTDLATGFAARTDSVAAADGVLELTYGTADPQTMTINVAAGTTLEALVNQINKDPDNPGVRASIVYDGSSYHLQVRGLDMGADKTVTIGAGTTLTGFEAADWTSTQAAQNAKFTVDGLAIESASNTVADVVEGLTFTVKDAGTTVITVANDEAAILSNVQSFVDKINEVRTALLNLTKFNDQTVQGSLLTGNYGLQIISSQLKEITAGKGLGFDYDADAISTLSQIGITTDAEEGSPTRGLLQIDQEDFLKALKEHPEELAALFSTSYEGETDSPDFSFGGYIKGMTEAGSYDVEYTTDGSGAIVSATIGGYAAAVSGTTLTGPSNSPVAGLVLNVANLTPSSTMTGTVHLKLGKAGEIGEKLTDLTSSVSGPLHILQKNYQNIINNINKKISLEEDRISRTETSLRLRFARLESTLSYYENMKTSLENQTKQLSSSTS
jgi:flagellar hook-associated protein 2